MKHTQKTKNKISATLLGRVSPMKGRHHSKIAKEKIRLSLLGNTRSLGFKHTDDAKHKIGIASSKRVREKSAKWKGDDVGYGVHKWVYKVLGQPTTCSKCGKTGLVGRQIHWSNKYHTYKRRTEDWQRLCCKCHKTYDKENGLIVPRNQYI